MEVAVDAVVVVLMEEDEVEDEGEEEIEDVTAAVDEGIDVSIAVAAIPSNAVANTTTPLLPADVGMTVARAVAS